MTQEANEIEVRLSRAEALTLFEFTSRFSETETLTIEHEAEAQALFNLCATFEKQLVEPFWPDYKVVLQRAWEKLCPPPAEN